MIIINIDQDQKSKAFSVDHMIYLDVTNHTPEQDSCMLLPNISHMKQIVRIHSLNELKAQ